MPPLLSGATWREASRRRRLLTCEGLVIPEPRSDTLLPRREVWGRRGGISLFEEGGEGVGGGLPGDAAMRDLIRRIAIRIECTTMGEGTCGIVCVWWMTIIMLTVVMTTAVFQSLGLVRWPPSGLHHLLFLVVVVTPAPFVMPRFAKCVP